jgi:1D-myo-inositol 3-kinase
VTGSNPEPVLLVGPVAIDEIEGERRLGGVVTYAATVVAAFGLRARILTTAAPDTDLISLAAGHDLHVVPADATLTFAFDQTPEGRQLTELAGPTRPLSATDLPDAWRSPATLILGTLIEDDIDLSSFAPIAQSAHQTAIVTQGLQRHATPTVLRGHLHEFNSLLPLCTPSTSLFRSEREAALWTTQQAAAIRETGARLVTTHGEHGAEIQQGDRRLQIAPVSFDSEIDSTGAGDIFASAFILALHEGDAAAGQLAAAFAAASVALRGPRPLPLRAEIERRLAAAAIVSDDVERGATD